jgi:hypothetical protein
VSTTKSSLPSPTPSWIRGVGDSVSESGGEKVFHGIGGVILLRAA